MGWVFFRIGASVMSAALGESVRTRRVIAADALERAELAERTREEEARARVDEERLRIAREVHDTVAHAIAIINVQSGVTAHLLDKRPDGHARRWRPSRRPAPRRCARCGPSSGCSAMPTTGACRTRVSDRSTNWSRRLATPDSTSCSRVSRDRALPSAVDSAAYRILQESITNVIRHVGSTRVTVGLDYGVDSLELCVTNERGDSSDGGRRSSYTGRGITGMRERCQLLGGDLDAGPSADGGFAVRARLPFAPSEGPALEHVLDDIPIKVLLVDDEGLVRSGFGPSSMPRTASRW